MPAQDMLVKNGHIVTMDSDLGDIGPKGVPHTVFGGPSGGTMLLGCGPKFEGLLREIADPAPEHVLPPPPDGPPDMALLLPIAERWAYGILGPPGPPLGASGAR